MLDAWAATCFGVPQLLKWGCHWYRFPSLGFAQNKNSNFWAELRGAYMSSYSSRCIIKEQSSSLSANGLHLHLVPANKSKLLYHSSGRQMHSINLQCSFDSANFLFLSPLSISKRSPAIIQTSCTRPHTCKTRHFGSQTQGLSLVQQ